MTTMNVEELQQCVLLVLDYVARQGLQKVDASDSDFYWTLTSEDWLVGDKDPKPAVGSLHDDIAELKRLLADPDRSSSVDLDRLASVLKLVSRQLSK